MFASDSENRIETTKMFDHRRPKREMRGKKLIIQIQMKPTRTWLLTTSGVAAKMRFTKMRFTRVCMGALRICFKYLKFNVLWIELTCLAFLSYSLLFHRVWGRFEAFSASYQTQPTCYHKSPRQKCWECSQAIMQNFDGPNIPKQCYTPTTKLRLKFIQISLKRFSLKYKTTNLR